MPSLHHIAMETNNQTETGVANKRYEDLYAGSCLTLPLDVTSSLKLLLVAAPMKFLALPPSGERDNIFASVMASQSSASTLRRSYLTMTIITEAMQRALRLCGI